MASSIIGESISLSLSLARTIARTGFAVLWAGQYGDGNEGSYESEIESNQNPSKDLGTAILQEEVEEEDQESVEGCGSDDTFDGSFSAVDGVVEFEKLANAEREDDQRGEGGEELECAKDALEERVKLRGLETGHEACHFKGFLG